MAAYVKFHQFVEDLALGVHNLHTGTIKDYLSNAAPDQTADLIKTDLAEIAGGNGYTATGYDTQNTVSETGGLVTVAVVDPAVITAAGGTIGPFRYVVAFNDTPTSPLDPLVASWDYGSAITLAIGETFTIDHTTNTLLTLQ